MCVSFHFISISFITSSILTGGTFFFLTDDSGIGGGHQDPELPNAVHEYLNALLVRIINGYHTGIFADPEPIVVFTEELPDIELPMTGFVDN